MSIDRGPWPHIPYNVDLVVRFINGINKRNLDALASLMTEDHTFVDSLGHELRGREAVLEGWRGYFSMMPEYEVEDDEMIGGPDSIAIFGIASGTYAPDGKKSPDRRWSTPAAWKAEIRGDQVAVWRVYADNKPVYDLMRSEPSEGE